MAAEKTFSFDRMSSRLIASRRMNTSASGGGIFTAQCRTVDGLVRWTSVTPNLVVNQGLQDMNIKYFTGTIATPFYVGLITGPASGTSFSALDTMTTHLGWSEFSDYTGDRPEITFGSANYANPSVVPSATVNFVITVAGVVAGAFLCTAATGTSGILFSESDFQSPGDRTVEPSDILSVSYTFSLGTLT